MCQVCGQSCSICSFRGARLVGRDSIFSKLSSHSPDSRTLSFSMAKARLLCPSSKRKKECRRNAHLLRPRPSCRQHDFCLHSIERTDSLNHMFSETAKEAGKYLALCPKRGEYPPLYALWEYIRRPPTTPNHSHLKPSVDCKFLEGRNSVLHTLESPKLSMKPEMK